MKKTAPLLLAAAAALLAACARPSASSGPRPLTIALLPKSKGNAYFVSVRAGAERAAKDLGVRLIFDGPTDPDPAKQNEIVDNWTTLGVDAIAAACENKEGISTALRAAQAKGIKVITYDADAEPDARSFFVNQSTSQAIADALMDDAARLCGGQGQYAMIVATVTAANMNEWRKYIALRNASSYPGMKLVSTQACDDMKDKAQEEATALLSTYPDLKLIMAICSPGVPGAAEAVKQAGKAGKVKVIGLGLPSENREYVQQGVTDNIILWNTEDLGYLTVQAAAALARGTLKPGDKTFTAGPLGTFRIDGDQIILTDHPIVFDRSNIDRYNF